MSKTTICDQCKKEGSKYHLTYHSCSHIGWLPHSWEVDKDFCSMKCLQAWCAAEVERALGAC